VISVADCKRQGVGLYWNWLIHKSDQQDSTNDVTGRPRGDVTRRYRDAQSKNDTDRWMRDRNPPGGRRMRRLDPLVHDSNQQQQQQQKLPRQRRRQKPESMTSRSNMEIADTTARGFYTSRGVPVTSRVALGDVTTFLTPARDVSRSQDLPMTSSLSMSTARRKDNDQAPWSKSYAGGWKMPRLLESPGQMSCIQLELVEKLDNISVVQVNLVPVVHV